MQPNSPYHSTDPTKFLNFVRCELGSFIHQFREYIIINAEQDFLIFIFFVCPISGWPPNTCTNYEKKVCVFVQLSCQAIMSKESLVGVRKDSKMEMSMCFPENLCL